MLRRSPVYLEDKNFDRLKFFEQIRNLDQINIINDEKNLDLLFLLPTDYYCL